MGQKNKKSSKKKKPIKKTKKQSTTKKSTKSRKKKELTEDQKNNVLQMLEGPSKNLALKTDGKSNKFKKINAPVALDVGFCFYERSLSTVKRAIESVKDHVRYIFAIDGKFEFFNSKELLSTKEVRAYLQSIPNVIMLDYPNRKENEKRQKYLDLAQEYMSDYLLILDADEFMTDECDWEAAYNHMAQQYSAEILPKIFGVIMRHGQKEASYPRIWRRPFLIQYMKTHNFWQFKTTGDIYKSQISFTPIRGMFMKGNDKERDATYIAQAYEYQLKLMEYEQPFKKEYRKIARNVSDKFSENRIPGIPLS